MRFPNFLKVKGYPLNGFSQALAILQNVLLVFRVQLGIPQVMQQDEGAN